MKAQTSTEYLIILAIVIVIALVVVGVMGGIPTLGGETSGRTGEAYWAQADIAIVGHKMSTAGADTFVIKNNKRFTVTVTEMLVNAVDITGGTDRTLAPGETLSLSAAVGLGTGSYSYDVTATYDDEDSGITGYTFSGAQKLTGEYEA